MRQDAGVSEHRPSRGQHRRSTGPEPDEELIRALHATHAAPLYAFVLRLVGGDRDRAQDVVRETLLTAWRETERLERGPGALRPWLVSVARRIALGPSGGRAPAPVPEPGEVDGALRMMAVCDALADLTESHREALTATYFSGRTAAQAAQELGVPAQEVRTRAFYALRRLKIALEERGVSS
ncbi:RNA polymerase subunit sigma [Streptomyces sp. ICBB 8177]|nr:RNA polymerase subunit sigma [Streptomyces sp. ICBB 8177]